MTYRNKPIVIYGNGSCGNHGCEAIVRGTFELLSKENTSLIIQSADTTVDTQYGLDQIGELRAAHSYNKNRLRFVKAYVNMRLHGNYTEMDGLGYISGIQYAARQSDLALSAGGDNYCYDGIDIYPWLNSEYHKYGMKTVLWGCSVEPEVVKKRRLQKDFSLYDGIVARESLSYEALRKVNEHVVLAPDPAFFMPYVPCCLDNRFDGTPVIGINASPHILQSGPDSDLVYENYLELVRFILQETSCSVALIPHVVWPNNDDRTVLKRLLADCKYDKRLILIGDHTAPELKYIISKCMFFVGARTHATIAAYSLGVPTLALGYSVKACGIARDLFGLENGYILAVQNLRASYDLTMAFSALYEKSDEIRRRYSSILPDYLDSGCSSVKLLKRILDQK